MPACAGRSWAGASFSPPLLHTTTSPPFFDFIPDFAAYARQHMESVAAAAAAAAATVASIGRGTNRMRRDACTLRHARGRACLAFRTNNTHVQTLSRTHAFSLTSALLSSFLLRSLSPRTSLLSPPCSLARSETSSGRRLGLARDSSLGVFSFVSAEIASSFLDQVPSLC